MASLPLVSKSASFALTFLLAQGLIALAQDSPAPRPSAKSVRFNFLPPPLEGSISLGIYDSGGKLVRVLYREADLDDFEIGNDALGATWDGRNDQGETLPPGKYHARGYVVGEVEGDGIGYFFNDWVVDDDSFHIRDVSRIWFQDGKLILRVEIPGNETLDVWCDDTGNTAGRYNDFLPTEGLVERDLPTAVEMVAWDSGRDGTIWMIDRIRAGEPQTEVKQFSATNELIRRLNIPATDPQPVGIAASKTDDRLFLLERSGAMARVRALTLLSSKQEDGRAVSDWKIEFEKKIVLHKDFTIQDGKPVVSGGKAPLEKVTIRLQPNPLKQDKKENVELAVGYDANGSFLKTADGLPLQIISDTPHLTGIVLSLHTENALDVFQDDGAVVEQFLVSGLDQMMAFDCGEIELK